MKKVSVSHLVLVLLGYSLFSVGICQISTPSSIPVCTSPVVATTLGNVCGNVQLSRLGLPYFQYLGIPYAEPPVGDLRFEAPVSYKKPWGLIPRPAVTWGNDCLQFDAIQEGKVLGDEDCLSLNIFTPQINPLVRLPVMIWVHGGGYFSGSSRLYNPDFFMDQQNIVVVSMNYRLASLGFLNTGDSLIRGNMGLKDQNMALKFVRDNIANFGGDPNRVTLFGESAGGASVHYHVISPKSKGLFHRAIMQSGNVFCPWALTKSPQNQAFQFGQSIGCPTTNTSVLVDCLKKMSGNRIVFQHAKVLSPVHTQNDFFGPSVEPVVQNDTFLSDNPFTMLQQGNFSQVPVIFGMNSGEGGLKTSRFEANPAMMNDLDTKWKEYFPTLLHYNPALTSVSSQVRQYYFPSSLPASDAQPVNLIPPQWTLENVTNMVSDAVWYHATKQAALYHSKFAPVYLNYFSYQSANLPYGYTILKSTQIRTTPPAEYYIGTFLLEAGIVETLNSNQSPKRFGACHADDLFFYWSLNLIFEYTLTPQDLLFSRDFVQSLTDFVRQVPVLKFQLFPWLSVTNTSSGPLQYMRLDKIGGMIDQPNADRVSFIESLNIRNPSDTGNW